MSLALLVVATAWILYQGWRWLGGARRSAPAQDAQPGATAAVGHVTFLVAAWNAAEEIPAFVRAFRALSYPDKDLVLCAGGRDGSLEVARALAGPDLTVVEQRPGEGKQRALRRGFPLVRGEVVYLTDVDCRPTDAAVEPLLRAVGAGAQAATGIVRPLPEQEQNAFILAQWAIIRFQARRAGPTVPGLHGANSVVCRAVLDATGGFAQDAPSGTDYTLAKELLLRGTTIAFRADSEMPTGYPDGLRIYVRKQARWLRNVAVLGSRYRAWGEVRSVGTTMAFPFGVLVLLLAGLWHWQVAALGVLLLLHAFLNRVRYVRAAGVRASASGAAGTVAGDLLAAMLAARQTLRSQMTWS